MTDSGVGIKKEDQSKLFKLFGFVADTSKMNTSGIGLGLVISDCLVTNLGGKITLESKENEGSTFSFTIKLHENSRLEHQSIAINPRVVSNLKLSENTFFNKS